MNFFKLGLIWDVFILVHIEALLCIGDNLYI